MTTHVEDIRIRQERAAEWISEAEKHIRAAKSLLRQEGLESIVLYHLQQSMEMATKGLARASGVPHRKFRSEIGHNNLFLFVKVIEIVVDSVDGHGLMNEVLARFYKEGKDYDSARHIQDVLAATTSPKRAQTSELKNYARKIFASGMKMPPEEVKSMLDSFDRTIRVMQVPRQVTRQIRKLLADPICLQTPALEVNWMDDIIQQATQQLADRVGARPDPTAMAFLQQISQGIATQEDIAAELEANKGTFYFDGRQLVEEISGMRDMLLANLGLLIVGSLVWAHESYPRYPAEPGAPDSIEQATRENKLGVKHYTAEMGVIKHIKPLTAKADKTIKLLKGGYKVGYLLMSAKDAKSVEVS